MSGSDRADTAVHAAGAHGDAKATLRRLAARLPGRLRGLVRPVTLWNYAQLLGGSVGRLGLSLAYVLALTRALDLADFGFFASAVAVGTVLSRVAGFGYGANLLQVSATRPRLLGTYAGIYGLWVLVSLPVAVLAAWAVYRVAFGVPGRFVPYLLVVVSEAVVWRLLDTLSAVNSGLGRFGLAAVTYNIGTAGRALAALLFLLAGGRDLAAWTHLYLAANVAALAVAGAAVMPRVRPRYRPGTAGLRWRNALALGAAGFATSAQAEVDKLLVLTFGGPVAAGLYAICIRVIDLTAVPTRAFNVLMIQRVLTDPGNLAAARPRALTEAAVALASTAGFAALLAAVRLWPGLLGQDIARAIGVLAGLWAVPALRNLIEYQAELLYAHRRMMALLRIALALTTVKTVLMALVFARFGQAGQWAVPMNGVFLATYAVSTLITYRGLARPEGRQP